MSNFNYIVTNGGNISVSIAGKKPYQVSVDHPNYDEIKEAVLSKDVEAFLSYVDVINTVKTFTTGKVVVDPHTETVTYNGEELHHSMVDRIFSLMRNGFPFEPLVKFLENLLQNPSNNSVEELYDFLEHTGLPITEEGTFIAYKAVRKDFKDIYSGTIENKPGNVVSVSRNKVDDRRENACSHGLHVGTFEYAKNYGGGNSYLMLVEVDPKDAVSVPTDHSCQKLRVCAYKILKIYDGDKEIDTPVYHNFDEDDDIDVDFDYGDDNDLDW